MFDERKLFQATNENTKKMGEAQTVEDVYRWMDEMKNSSDDGDLFEQDDAKRVQELIDNGCDVNATNFFGETPLSTARTKEVIKVLLDNGADAYANGESVIRSWQLKSEMAHYFFELGVMYNISKKVNIPRDECTSKYNENTDRKRRKIALVFKHKTTFDSKRISYNEACKRVGDEEELKMLIENAHEMYLEKNEVVPFNVYNGQIYAYVL